MKKLRGVIRTGLFVAFLILCARFPGLVGIAILGILALLFLPGVLKNWNKPTRPDLHLRVQRPIDPVLEAQQRKTRGDCIARELSALRESIAISQCPTIGSEIGLLRDRLAREFVSKRPTNRNEWFQKISFELRDQTDSDQVRNYLPTILQVIRNHEKSSEQSQNE